MSEQPTNPNPQNLSELDPEADVDPLTDTKTVAQTPTPDEEIYPLPEGADGTRAGAFDPTTGAAHPSAEFGTDKGASEV